MDEESISDANNVTADTFRHTPITKIDNTSAMIKNEKLDKLDDLADTLKDLTINDNKYYASNSVTASDAQGDLTRDPNTFTHTSNSNFEQTLLSNHPSQLLSQQ